MNGRILHLAISDGRGHLMRAHLLRTLLARVDVEVSIVTTSRAGQSFLARMGHPSHVLGGGYHLELDAFHDLDAAATRARTLRYLASTALARDLKTLELLAADADLVVNDSLHPALLLAAAWKRKLRVVQLVGENILRSARAELEAERGPLGSVLRALFARSFDGAFGRVIHTLGDTSADELDRTWRLAPLTDSPTRTREDVRRSLACGARPLLAVYLNPHYTATQIAEAVERAASRGGFQLYAVSEAFSTRPGWRAADPRLVDVIAAADVLVSGAGMAAVEQSRAFSLPLVAVLGTQPEQRANLEEARARGGAPILCVSSTSTRLAAELEAALLSARDASPPLPPSPVQAAPAWERAFTALIHAARTERSNARAHGRTGHRDGEPRGWRSRAG